MKNAFPVYPLVVDNEYFVKSEVNYMNLSLNQKGRKRRLISRCQTQKHSKDATSREKSLFYFFYGNVIGDQSR